MWIGDDMGERESVIGARNGERDAFGTLVARYSRRAYGFFLARTGNGPMSEELVQESWVRAFVGIGKLRDPDRFGAWFFAICRNELRRAKSDRAAREVPFDEEAHGFPDDAREGPWSAEAMEAAIDRLGPSRSELLRLRFSGRLSYAEIAAATSQGLPMAKGRLHRAKAALADALRHGGPDPKTIERMRSIVMERTDLVRDAARVFSRLSLADQRDFVLATRRGRRFPESLIASIGSIRRGREFLAAYGAELAFSETVHILGYVDRGVEARVFEELEASEPEVALAAMRSMFVFEDLFLCEDRAVALIAERVDERVLGAALGATLAKVRARVLSALEPGAADRLRAIILESDAWGDAAETAKETIVEEIDAMIRARKLKVIEAGGASSVVVAASG